MDTSNTVISTRVRFARNLADYPFASRMDKTSAREINERVRAALPDYDYVSFDDISPLRAKAYVEEHAVSPEFLRSPYEHGLLTRGDIKIMVCEEDHLRVQCIMEGCAVTEALQSARAVCRELESKLKIAYSEEWGYLTHCPTNLGTGMRISVMMFLPALTMSGAMESLCSQLGKLGLTVRGFYGEGSEEKGYLYQISNQVTLGLSEADTASKLNGVITEITRAEERAAAALDGRDGEAIADMASRALGTLKYARLLTGEEFMTLYGRVRFGAVMGYVHGVDVAALDGLLTATRPATLALECGENAQNDSRARDRARAEKVRGVLK